MTNSVGPVEASGERLPSVGNIRQRPLTRAGASAVAVMIALLGAGCSRGDADAQPGSSSQAASTTAAKQQGCSAFLHGKAGEYLEQHPGAAQVAGDILAVNPAQLSDATITCYDTMPALGKAGVSPQEQVVIGGIAISQGPGVVTALRDRIPVTSSDNPSVTTNCAVYFDGASMAAGGAGVDPAQLEALIIDTARKSALQPEFGQPEGEQRRLLGAGICVVAA